MLRREFLLWTAGASALVAISPAEAFRALRQDSAAGVPSVLRVNAQATEPGVEMTISLLNRRTGAVYAERSYRDVALEPTTYEIVLCPEEVGEIDFRRVDVSVRIGSDEARIGLP